MLTLVIHPRDNSTDFLKPIYSAIPNSTIITGGCTKSELKEQIEMADEVIICGHGSQSGLFAIGQFKDLMFNDYIIDGSIAPLLKGKKKVVTIWCYAKGFIDTYNIKQAYYSDMFISEVDESIYCGLKGVNQDQVNESNNCFSNCLFSLVHLDPGEIHGYMKESAYAQLAKINPVAAFNYPKLGTNALE